MAVHCGTVTVLYCVTVCILVLELSVLRSAVLCLWKEQTDSAVWHSYSVVLCDSVYIGNCVGCVTVSSVVFMEGTVRQCILAQLQCCMCDSVYIGIWC